MTERKSKSQIDRKIERQEDRKTQRQKDRKRGKQKDRKKEYFCSVWNFYLLPFLITDIEHRFEGRKPQRRKR